MPFRLRRRRLAGFSLIELVTAMTIVSILATIAITSYSAYVLRTNRAYATTAILTAAQGLQRCYSQNFTYQNGTSTPCTIVAGTTTTPDGYYSINIAIDVPSASCQAPNFQITATPAKPPQTTDSRCAQFQLQCTGQQTASNAQGGDNSQSCWGGR